MPTPTTFLGLSTYNPTTDGSALFQDFRGDVAGTVSTSNMNKIDAFATTTNASLVSLSAKKYIVVVPATYSSENYYIATGISEITSYTVNQIINLSLDTTNNGTVTLNINSLGTKSLQKVNFDGTLVNFEANELKKNHLYFFKYNGSVWVWIDANSIDQIGTIGIANDLLMISPCGVVVDSTITTTGSRIAGSYISLPLTGVVSGSYNTIQVDAYGRVISGSNLDSYANKTLTNLTSASITIDFNPDSSGTRNLGSAIKSWFYGWFRTIGFISGSASTPSASQVVLYSDGNGLFAKNSSGEDLFVSTKKIGNFWISYPVPTVTNPATAASQIELSSENYSDFTAIGFSNSGSPTGSIDFGLPWDYDGGTLTAVMHFSPKTNASGSGIVKFGVCGRAYADGDSLDQAPSSLVYTTKTAGSSLGIYYQTAISGSFAVSGSPAPLNMVKFIFQRDNSVADNLGAEIRLHGAVINYTRSQG
jgi:hypothetical protein